MPQKDTSVSIDAHFERFIARQIQEGRYGSADKPQRMPGFVLTNEAHPT
ncbi:MAG: type II toxin-antitoxin system ParD family antitoxin [Proteobacteria bacterium]|nr:type II toxin-antitoxin system ParD family antitoxin [Pseudomonadota bacterium]